MGNILGSCIFNLLGILGVTALVVPLEIPREVFLFDLPVMIATAIACLPIMFTGHRINRWEGFMLTAGFIIYTTLLFVGWPFPADRSGQIDSPPPVSSLDQGPDGVETHEPRLLS